MKVRVTIMTENDKHLPDFSKEEIETIAKLGWNAILATFETSDVAYVESCELVEE